LLVGGSDFLALQRATAWLPYPGRGNGHQLGEYQGLTALPARGFAALFSAPAPLAKDGPTDIFFARIGPG